mmetsp:Transcript_1911/g.4060  ORF Transcript_1911/g.4060 Transcript_1911/m.4060 type:complete len:163 (+) Transcript_1911:145-633(+)|eukprot:CAMPEP_0201119150 /NCGR_PEP_ID=MMETSP0850-20130426/3319_1 /ASSEMBLY_ACC=CAM_ASM_000622 /TAXON_ID=183588 /ORGANISM="Pseudo-nitzschia fraudulenta, Strain WWA7" /LENGTH=162 /DNA_ID=CAMNT_0047384739 /DNA_START=150 /DNA_END=638 /DNA_ORIENTATION=-
MKTYFSFALLCFQALAVSGFMSVAPRSASLSTTQRQMFGGAGAGTPTEDDPEADAQMEQAAASMGMSADEYRLAMRAREQLAKSMDSKIVTAGSADTVLVERDVNNPPRKFDVTITEEGKALGADAVSKKLVEALNKGSELAAKGRQEAQQDMLKWVQAQAP